MKNVSMIYPNDDDEDSISEIQMNMKRLANNWKIE
jgi:hypothetical protein